MRRSGSRNPSAKWKWNGSGSSRTRGVFPHQRENEQREITREPLVMASEIGGLEPLHGYLKHGNLVVRMRIPYLKLEEPAEKFIERKMTTPAMPATEPEPVCSAGTKAGTFRPKEAGASAAASGGERADAVLRVKR